MRLKNLLAAFFIVAIVCSIAYFLRGVSSIAQSAAPPSARPTPRPLEQIDTGPNKSLYGNVLFPPDDPWNRDVSKDPIDPRSAEIIAAMNSKRGLHPDFGTVSGGVPNGMPYVIVGGNQPKVPVQFHDADESDPGPYPVPPDAPVEGGANNGGDGHVLVLDKDNHKLYELFMARLLPDGHSWSAGSGAIFDLTKTNPQRPAYWTSTDAAGLAVLPGLVRYDEVVEQHEIRHALRFTVARSRHAYVSPATHYSSNRQDPNLPPMGLRVRLKASIDLSRFPPNVRVILQSMKTYGMLLADNGSDWYVCGAPDPRWNDDELHRLGEIKGSDFEVVKMGTLVTD